MSTGPAPGNAEKPESASAEANNPSKTASKPGNRLIRVSDYFELISAVVLIIEFALALGSFIMEGSYNRCNLFFGIVGGTYFLFCSLIDQSNILTAILFFINVILYVPLYSFTISSIFLLADILAQGKFTNFFIACQFLVVPESIFRFFLNLSSDKVSSSRHIAFLVAHFILQERKIWKNYKNEIRGFVRSLRTEVKMVTPLNESKK